MKAHSLFSALTLFALSLALTTSAYAYLGSFDVPDGYNQFGLQVPGTPPSDFGDVTYYNAGVIGPKVQIPFNTGQWQLLTQAGAYFATSAIRNPNVGSAPPYPAFPFSVAVPDYVIGNHPGGRTGGALALRNEGGPDGAMEYDYTLDSVDFGGPAPGSVTAGSVLTEFYFCPNGMDSNPTNEKFIMSFRDSTGSTGLQVGYRHDNQVQWRPGNSGSWTATGITADSLAYDGFRVDMNLSADTFQLEYFDVSASTWSTLAVAGTPLGASMQNLTDLRWWLDELTVAGDPSGYAGKNFFDDFSFKVTPVPEPSTCLLMLTGLCGWLVRRR
jgi:hypothetical protein